MIRPRTADNSAGRAYPVLIGLAALGLVGYFGPWVPHKAAGLVITGLDLAEYVKFVPQVASGQITLRREFFYLPLLAGSLISSLFAARRGSPRWLRLILALISIPLALAMLPPAWTPDTLRLPEYRAQVLAIAGCLAFLPLAQLVCHPAARSFTLTLAAAPGLLAAIVPASEFLKLRPALADIYGTAILPGWGFWGSTLGLAGFALVAIATALRPSHTHR